MRLQRSAPVVLFLLVLAMGCRKDGDTSPPVVQIITPNDGHYISVPDTLPVSVRVSDDRSVKSVTITLGDVNGVPVAPSIIVTLDASTATLQRELVVSNERLESGMYTLAVRATDGTHTSSDFVAIQLTAAPLRLRAVFITPAEGSLGSSSLLRIDSLGELGSWASLGEWGGATIDPEHLYTAGTFTQPLTSHGVNDGNTSTLLPNLNTGGSTTPYFFGLSVDPQDGRIYCGTKDGAIVGMRPQGTRTFNAWSPQGTISIRTTVLGERLVAACRNLASTEHRLVTYNSASGTLLFQTPLDVEPLGLYRRTSDQVLVFGNRNGSGVIQDRNAAQGGNFEMRIFTSDPLMDVVRLDENTFILALASGIVRFHYANNTLNPVAPGIQAQCLAHDAVSGALYAGVGNDLIRMDVSTGTVVPLMTLPIEAGRILPLMNR